MYAGQLLVGDAQTGGIKRVFLDPVVDEMQGCVFRFSAGVADHVSALASTPDGSILVATDPLSELSLVDVLKPIDRHTFEMCAVRAMSNGLSIEFTEALDSRVGWDPESYYVEQWPWRHATGEGRPTRDGSSLPVKSASVSQSGKQVFLEVDGLKEGHLVYLRLLPPCLSQDGDRPWSTEAWYTLKAIPRGRIGTILPSPPSAPQNLLTAEERAAGWRLLFDGKTTRGWRGFRKDHMPDGWQVIKGCLVRMSPGGDIITEQQFDDFELTLEWRISPGGNSGIFFRVSEEENVVWRTGPEMQVLDNSAHADGRNELTSAGANYALHAPVRDVAQPVGLFNKVRILVDGSHVEQWLNGVKIVEYELESPEWERLVAASKFKSMPRHGRTKKGHIALQDHGDKVWYRNIKIRAIDHD
jgi:cytochrome c